MGRVNNMMLPEKIQALVEGRKFETDSVGLSGGQVILFDDMVLKIEKASCETQNACEIMKWLEGKLPVPKIIANETDSGINYLLMTRIQGEMSCDDRYLKNPELLTSVLAEGIKLLQSVDISDCPCFNGLDVKLKEARERVENNLVDINDCEPETFGEGGFKSPAHLLEWLEGNRPEEDVVFSHGDYCLPNIFVNDGRLSGFIDLGRAGTADKWQDIALCSRSLEHNFDGHFTGIKYHGFDGNMLFQKLGITPDPEKLRYYILLDELF